MILQFRSFLPQNRTRKLDLMSVTHFSGAFGFLPIFNSYDDVIGNFGLRDQQVALQWVKQNMAAFDGDPNKVSVTQLGL